MCYSMMSRRAPQLVVPRYPTHQCCVYKECVTRLEVALFQWKVALSHSVTRSLFHCARMCVVPEQYYVVRYRPIYCTSLRIIVNTVRVSGQLCGKPCSHFTAPSSSLDTPSDQVRAGGPLAVRGRRISCTGGGRRRRMSASCAVSGGRVISCTGRGKRRRMAPAA